MTLRKDYHGFIKNPLCPRTTSKAASVDFVTYNHVHAGQFGYAVAHTALRTRKGKVLPKDIEFAKQEAKKLNAHARVWLKGVWWSVDVLSC